MSDADTKLEIALIPYGRLSYVIPGMLQYLEKSKTWAMGRVNIDDILRFLLTGDMRLWLVFDRESSRIYGYVITEEKQYPQCKMLVCQYCAGEPHHMKYVEEKMHGTLERFAHDAGCAGVEFFGRPGWGKHMKKYGYTTQTVVYENLFNGEQP